MKKFYSIFIILVLMAVCGSVPLVAQEARVTVSYTEDFNSYSYTGQEDDGEIIHAIGGGTAGCSVTVESLPRDAQLDSIYIRMSDVNNPVKLTTTTGEASFTIADISSLSTYSFTATVFYSTEEETGSREFRGDKRISVYPLPAWPDASPGDRVVYERGASATVHHAISTASGANPSGWQYNWTVTTRENGTVVRTETPTGNSLDYTVNTSFPSDVKNLRQVSFELSVINENPVKSGEAWVRMSYGGFGSALVYNVPAHQPTKLGHFTDVEAGQDFYVAMDMGVTDLQITTGGYEFNFLGNDNLVVTGNTRTVDCKESHNTFNNVFVQWTYDEDNKFPIEAPAQVVVVELSLDYKYTDIQFEPHNDYKNDPRYSQTAIRTGPSLHYFKGSNVKIFHEVKGVGFDIEGSSRVTSHLGTTLPGSANVTGDYTWRNLETGIHAYYLEVKGKMRVETAVNVTVDITGKYTPEGKIQIWDVPVPAKVESLSKECTDIQPAEMAFTVTEPSGGFDVTVTGPSGDPEVFWKFEWMRQNKTDGVSETLSSNLQYTDNEIIEDNSEGKNIRKFDYILTYYNIAPDQETKWFTDTIKAGELTVYNAPRAPQSLLYIIGENETIIAATNIGLSDEQLDELGYEFFYEDESAQNAFQSDRRYSGEIEPQGVACAWKYIETIGEEEKLIYTAFSETAAKTIADLGKKFVVETSTKDKDEKDIIGYLGAVTNGNDIYALSGSQNRLKVQVSNNYEVKKATITINDNMVQEATLEGNSASLAFCPEDEEVSEYTFMAQIDYRAILDSYTQDGQTQYVYATSEEKPQSENISSSDRLHVYPRAIVPEVKLDSVYVTDWELKNLDYAIEAATGANASAWKYSWESGEAENVVRDMKCTVVLKSVGSIDGPSNTVKNVKVRAKYTNESPVQGQNWFETYVDIADVNIYNRPNPVGSLVKYKDQENEYYIAKGLNCGDANLKNYDYRFRFFNGDKVIYEGNGRSVRTQVMEIAPDKVCTVFTYPKDANHDEYVIATEPVAYSGVEVTPKFNERISREKDELCKEYNYSYRHSPELGFYDLVGCKYNFSVYTEGDFSLVSGKLDDILNAQGSTLEFIRNYNQEGEFLPKVSGELLYAAEPGIAVEEGKYTTLHFDYTYPSQSTVHIYPTPEVPDEFALDKVQFRDIDPIIPMDNEVSFRPSGANAEGWDFNWTFDNQSLGHSMEASPQPISSAEMDKQYHVFKYRWMNASPMPNDPEPYWLSHEFSRNITVYNTPEAPGAFVRKGNGTSGIYIANNMALDDDRLNELNYQFQFGDNDPVEENAISTEGRGRRWYTYTSPNRPWVRSVWGYEDGFLCYSNFVIADGSRAEMTVADIFNYEGEDMLVYTISGAALGNVSLHNLTTGLYIVEIGTGDDKLIRKVYVK